MKWQRCVGGMAAVVLAVTASVARADVFNMGAGLTSLDFVTVANPGNAGERYSCASFVGGVDYVYTIGKYEVTTGQYTAFLNAVAATDTYGLYNTNMRSNTYGCKIWRLGSPGSYSYTVPGDRANRPLNYVSWGDAARFVNWLHNGQPTGVQGAATTEDGAYTLNGATTPDELVVITRNADAKFWIPSEDEWYKAAYHKNDGVTGNYWDYPTGSDSVPSNLKYLIPDPGNNANFYENNRYTIGSPYWMTEVGAFTNSESPYGTFDQCGNVWEWTEEVVPPDLRGVRGGAWAHESYYLQAFRFYYDLKVEYNVLGFRVASVPEPGSMTLIFGGAIAGLLWWRRKRRA